MRGSVTVRPTPEQAIRWADAACRYGRSVPAFLAFAADWTERYFREGRRLRKADAVERRMEEKRRMGALLQAAKAASGYVPDYVARPMGGRLPVGRDLARAIESVEQHLADGFEDFVQ